MTTSELIPASPDDLIAQALENFSVASDATVGDGTTPALPPALAAMHNKSGPEILADLNKSPLFMTDLEENDELEAFKAMAYEGTPAEVALGFKEHGNECFKGKKWVDAKEFFTKGIQVLVAEQRKRTAVVKSDDAEEADMEVVRDDVKEELIILEASLANRAACHLKLQNYRSCTLDCAAALRLNPKNIKAFFRSASALLALKKIPEADDACAHGLALDPTNKDLLAIAEKLVKINAEVQAKKQKELLAEQKKKREAYLLRAALKARNIKIRKTPQPPEMEDAKVQLMPDPSDPKSWLIFPTVLLYPVHLQSDFIKDFSELETLGYRLEHILAEPMQWDTAREYQYKKVDIYMETLTGGLIKIGKSATLLKVLGESNVEVVDDVVRFFVVPRARAEAWIKDFKMKKAAEKGSV